MMTKERQEPEMQDLLRKAGKALSKKRWGEREPIECPHCGSMEGRKHGIAKSGKQQYSCADCKKWWSK